MKHISLRRSISFVFSFKRPIHFLLISTGLFIASCQKYPESKLPEAGKIIPTSNDKATVATDWYKLQLRMILQAVPAKSNLAAIRLFAYSGVTLFESSRFEILNSKSLQGQLAQMPTMPTPDHSKRYSWVISANAAMASITRYIFPGLNNADSTAIDSLEKVYVDKISGNEGAETIARSQAFGDSVASAIFNWTKTDLFNHASDVYTPPVFPGAWDPTPPAFAAAAGPYFGNCRTFMNVFAEGTTDPPPYAYSEDTSSNFFKMVNNDYLVSKSLTTDQKNIALFWNDVGANIGYTPMGHCISIVTQVLDNSHASLSTADLAYVKAGIAMWDAAIVCWRSKYKYNQIRPVSYIQNLIDKSWLPYITTPAHPEFPAAHAFITSSMMEAMTHVFGSGYGFTDHTYDFQNYPSRSYTSFEDAALECGQSRVYGGIHYQPSVDLSHVAGSLVGKAASEIQVTR